MKRHLISLFAICALFFGCAVGPDFSNYEWRKHGGTTDERNRFLAEAKVHAIQAYPDPISQEQIYAEPINAGAVRGSKRNEVIINFMASKGWSFVPRTQN